MAPAASTGRPTKKKVEREVPRSLISPPYPEWYHSSGGKSRVDALVLASEPGDYAVYPKRDGTRLFFTVNDFGTPTRYAIFVDNDHQLSFNGKTFTSLPRAVDQIVKSTLNKPIASQTRPGEGLVCKKPARLPTKKATSEQLALFDDDDDDLRANLQSPQTSQKIQNCKSTRDTKVSNKLPNQTSQPPLVTPKAVNVVETVRSDPVVPPAVPPAPSTKRNRKPSLSSLFSDDGNMEIFEDDNSLVLPDTPVDLPKTPTSAEDDALLGVGTPTAVKKRGLFESLNEDEVVQPQGVVEVRESPSDNLFNFDNEEGSGDDDLDALLADVKVTSPQEGASFLESDPKAENDRKVVMVNEANDEITSLIGTETSDIDELLAIKPKATKVRKKRTQRLFDDSDDGAGDAPPAEIDVSDLGSLEDYIKANT